MSNERGFSIIEVLVAVLILTVGVLGLASTAALVTRMIGQGQRFSQANALANERFEILRTQRCSAMAAGSGTSGPYSFAWAVDSTGLGVKGRRIRVIVRSPTGAATTRADTFTTIVFCDL